MAAPGLKELYFTNYRVLQVTGAPPEASPGLSAISPYVKNIK
jgi:hypothetical protein